MCIDENVRSKPIISTKIYKIFCKDENKYTEFKPMGYGVYNCLSCNKMVNEKYKVNYMEEIFK